MSDFKFRKHQDEAIELARAIIDGEVTKKIVTASVTPGGGKTLLSSVFAHELIQAGAISRVLYVAPRISLRTQAIQGFTRDDLGLTGGLALFTRRYAMQENMHSRAGMVTTYQAVAAQPKAHEKYIRSEPTLLIADEVHHLSTDPDLFGEDQEPRGKWLASFGPLVDAAKFVLLMSGTLRRHSGEAIPFVRYDENKVAVRDIDYSRRQALDDEAILPCEFRLYDGKAMFEHRRQVVEVNLSAARTKAQRGYAIRTCLMDPGYRDRMALAGLREWLADRASVYRSRAIVVCNTQADAKHIAALIRRELRDEGGRAIRPALAISDLADSHKVIERFRDKDDGDVLVTVDMAYEGLDVPDCTHLVYLKRTRSTTWMEQTFARVSRFDRRCNVPFHDQRPKVFVMDDPETMAFIDTILEEQEASYRERKAGAAQVAPMFRSTFRPLEAELGSSEIQDEYGRRFSAQLLDRLVGDMPSTRPLPPADKLRIAMALYGASQ